ncbi:unnamed protein product [Acanthoscelides obtectus]|uniref:Vps16 C-terminal domain-containing protein n=1 Tax=Acanthoscelides obtectus TaxID=200917 RepID=A0A9P0Q5D3_ACAOB|nr:unnamed protein product [Acanthoscelides obtectus]CAK1655900.1 Vacuolar protein sorting-associated protein 16 homolog [Acanthoscelides obtectus]
MKAIESGDTDLIHMVIIKLRDKMTLGDFKMTIRSFRVAQSIYIKYCKEHKQQALNEIYIQEDDFDSQAETFISENSDSKGPEREAYIMERDKTIYWASCQQNSNSRNMSQKLVENKNRKSGRPRLRPLRS